MAARQAVCIPRTAGDRRRRVRWCFARAACLDHWAVHSRALQSQCISRVLRHRMARRSINLMRWKCFIPGKAGTDWDGGFFPLTMDFPEEYPAKPPKARAMMPLA